METYLRNYSDYDFSVAGEKPNIEFMDYQNNDTIQIPVVVAVPVLFENSKPKIYTCMMAWRLLISIRMQGTNFLKMHDRT